jgi:hypothetical protein
MAIQDTTNVSVAVRPESTWGDEDGNQSGYQAFRFSKITGKLKQEYKKADEIRTDRTRGKDVRVSRGAEVTLEAPAIATNMHPVYRSALQYAPVTATTVANDVSFVAADSSINRAAGSFVSENYAAGMWIKVATGLNAGHWRITSVVALKMVLAQGPAALQDVASAAIVVTGAKHWRHAAIGSGTKKSDGVIIRQSGLDKTFYYPGCIPSKFSTMLKAADFMTQSASWTGKTEGIYAGVGQTVTAAPTGDPQSASFNVASVRLTASAFTGYSTDISIDYENTLEERQAIANLGNVDIGVHSAKASGKVTIFFQTETEYNLYVNGTTTGLNFRLVDDAGAVEIHDIPSAKITDAQITREFEKGVMAELTFEAQSGGDVFYAINYFAP